MGHGRGVDTIRVSSLEGGQEARGHQPRRVSMAGENGSSRKLTQDGVQDMGRTPARGLEQQRQPLPKFQGWKVSTQCSGAPGILSPWPPPQASVLTLQPLGPCPLLPQGQSLLPP